MCFVESSQHLICFSEFLFLGDASPWLTLSLAVARMAHLMASDIRHDFRGRRWLGDMSASVINFLNDGVLMGTL